MKLFAVALVASLFVAVSLAAPTTPEPSFDDLFDLDEGKSVTVSVERLECIRRAVRTVLVENEVDQSWQVFNSALDFHFNNYKQCVATSNDRYRCGRTLLKQSGRTLGRFLRVIFSSDLNLYQKIRAQIARDFYRKPSAESFVEMIETEEYTITVEENKESPSNETVDYVGILACAIEVAENVTIEFGLVTIYESFEPQFLLHLASFQNCSSVGDADVVQACFERESEAASKTFEKFLGLVQEENEEAANAITRLYHSVCLNVTPTTPTEPSIEVFDVTENTPSNKTGNYVAVLECAIKAAEDISTEYGFDEDYELFQSLILAHLVIMKNCAEAGDAEAVQACVEKEAQAATAKFEEWLELIRAHNEEAADAFVEIYETACLNGSGPTPTPIPL